MNRYGIRVASSVPIVSSRTRRNRSTSSASVTSVVTSGRRIAILLYRVSTEGALLGAWLFPVPTCGKRLRGLTLSASFFQELEHGGLDTVSERGIDRGCTLVALRDRRRLGEGRSDRDAFLVAVEQSGVDIGGAGDRRRVPELGGDVSDRGRDALAARGLRSRELPRRRERDRRVHGPVP